MVTNELGFGESTRLLSEESTLLSFGESTDSALV